MITALSTLLALIAAPGTSTVAAAATSTQAATSTAAVVVAAKPPLEVAAPPVLPHIAERDRPASVRGRARTFVLAGSEPVLARGPSGEILLIERTFVPVVQEIFLDAETGVRGLSIALDAWGGVDAADRVLSNRVLGDIGVGWLRLHRRHFTLTAGRIQSYSPLARGLRFDGAQVRVHPMWEGASLRPTLEAWGGVPVSPRYGDEALLTDRPAPSDPVDVARGLADWERPGDWGVGAMLGLDWQGMGGFRVGYTRVMDLAEIDREAAVAELVVEPWYGFALTGFGSFDVYAEAIEDAEVELRARPTPWLHLAGYGRMRDPELLLSSTSILSVFGGAAHRELGLTADVFLGQRLRASVAGELRQTEATETRRSGTEEVLSPYVSISLRGRVPRLEILKGQAAFEYLADDGLGGYWSARAGLELRATDWLTASVDGATFRTQDQEDLGLRGGVAASLEPAEGWRVVAALRGTRAPDGTEEIVVIGRFEWNAFTTF